MRELTHLSLFTGFGGFDIAAEMAGFVTVGQVEFADYPTKVLEKHWPTTPRWRDIRSVTYESFVQKTGRRTVDVISGGFPCQPFSDAGKKRGKKDDRYLWPEMLRVISEIRPNWVIGENVRGIVDMALDTILANMEDAGYEVQAFNIPAAGIGANHKRERIFIVGCRHDMADTQSEQDHGRENGIMDEEARGREGKHPAAGIGRQDMGDANNHGQNEIQEPEGPEQGGQYGERRTGQAMQSEGSGGSRGRDSNMADTHEGRCQGDDRGKHEDEPEIGCPKMPNTDKQHDGHAGHGTGAVCRKPMEAEIFADIPDSEEQGLERTDAAREAQAGRWAVQYAELYRRAVKPGLGGMAHGFTNWMVEPDIPRIAYGIPDRTSRIAGLGNMVVPQVVFPIFYFIAKIIRGEV